MIEIEDSWVGKIPVLEIVPAELKDEKIPTVIFYHGWTNVKERVLANGYEIARQGMRVIIPEALYHGARSDGLDIEEHFMDFWQIILQSVAEFPQLAEHYVAKGLSDPERLGVAGLSMGGITTCALMATYPEIKAANCLMGAPNFRAFNADLMAGMEAQGIALPEGMEAALAQLNPYDLGCEPSKIAGRPFHFWHGTADQTVPFANSHDFYNQYATAEFGKQLSYTQTGDGHRVPHDICLESGAFFKAVL